MAYSSCLSFLTIYFLLSVLDRGLVLFPVQAAKVFGVINKIGVILSTLIIFYLTTIY